MASFVEQHDSNADPAPAQIITQMECPDTETNSTISPRRRSSRHSPQRQTSSIDTPQLWLELYQASYNVDDSGLFTYVPETPNCTVFQSAHPPISAAYNQLYSMENPIFQQYYITHPDYIRSVLPMYVSAAISGNPLHGMKLATFYGASSELMQMVVDDLTANPFLKNPSIPHASSAVVNPEAVSCRTHRG